MVKTRSISRLECLEEENRNLKEENRKLLNKIKNLNQRIQQIRRLRLNQIPEKTKHEHDLSIEDYFRKNPFRSD